VPCGNFGNITAGLIAKRMGLPIKKFIAATNENNEFQNFLETGTYKKIAPSKNCISNAMNVGHPSNLARIISLYGGQMDENGTITKMPNLATIKEDFFACSTTDKETEKTIENAYKNNKLLLEPHGAVAWNGLEQYLASTKETSPCVSLETADPAKFPKEIEKLLSIKPKIPKSMKKIDTKKEYFETIEASLEELKKRIS
jgi:threonine synthase